jgi:hypothetical protein
MILIIILYKKAEMIITINDNNDYNNIHKIFNLLHSSFEKLLSNYIIA